MNGPAAYSSVRVGARSAYPAAVTAVRCSSSRYSLGANPLNRLNCLLRPVSFGSDE